MNRRTQIAGRLGLLVVIVILGVALLRHRDAPPAKQAALQGAPTYYYDPMHPDQHFDKPGKSPFMDMQLVPKYAEGPTSHGSGVPASNIEIDPRIVQTLGIRLATVEQSSFARVVDTVGLVAVDDNVLTSFPLAGIRNVGGPSAVGTKLACPPFDCLTNTFAGQN